MALINCPECNKQVSNMAPTCVGCGFKISADRESAGSGVAALTTTQTTSKKLKGHILMSSLMFWVGLLIAIVVAGGDPSSDDPPKWSILMTIVGFLWYVVTRFKIWWHHK